MPSPVALHAAPLARVIASPLKLTLSTSGTARRKLRSASCADAKAVCAWVLSISVPGSKPTTLAVGLKFVTGLTNEPILPWLVVIWIFLAVMFGVSGVVCVEVVVCNNPALMPESSSLVVQT